MLMARLLSQLSARFIQEDKRNYTRRVRSAPSLKSVLHSGTRIIYSLVLEFGDKPKPIEFVLLKQALKDRNKLEEIGGPEYLSDLLQLCSNRGQCRLLNRYRPQEVCPGPIDFRLQQAFDSVLRFNSGGNRTAVG
jgi:hypothetical protein